MKLNIQFDDNIQIEHNMSVVIDSNGKLREYSGIDFAKFLFGHNTEYENKTFNFDSDFTLIKLSNYDIKKLNKAVNYQLDCSDLFQKTVGMTNVYLKLSFIQKFKIDYWKKETVFHKMNMTQKLLGLLLVSIPLTLFTFGIKQCSSPKNNSSEKIETTQVDDLDIKNKDSFNSLEKKANSNKTLKIDSLKLATNLTPRGYTLLNVESIELTDKNTKALLLHFKSNKKVECYFDDLSQCYQDEIHIYELLNNTWLKVYSSPIENPIKNDTLQNLYTKINSKNQLVINSYCKPTGYSKMNETHFYKYQNGTFLLDSINLSIDNSFRMEYTTWDYSIDLTKNIWKRRYIHSVYSDSLENFTEDSLITLNQLKINHTPTLSTALSAVKILKDDLTYSL
jgi:hypothetical protein